MKSIEDIANNMDNIQINESQLYDELIKNLQEAKNNEVLLHEGILTGLLGGAIGATVGPTIMKAVCNALGIDIKGPLGSLMTSRLILTTVGAKVGW